jgi:hypothetical protein
MSNNRITPFVKRMRTNGGTIFTFSSAVEDIGLNINERNNVVKISHFALLNIPSIVDDSSLNVNTFNLYNTVGDWEYGRNSASIKDGRVLIPESFQNYALNFEANLLNQDDYNATLTRTVSERVFWKWLKETGAIRFDKDVSVGSTQYWGEELDADGSLGYNRVVKYIGQVSAGNVRSDTFGTYNETYILVPTSHGQTDAYFQMIEDDNYYHGMEIGDLSEKILGRESYTLPHPDGLDFLAYYDFVDSSTELLLGNTYDLTYDHSMGSYSAGWWYTGEGIAPSSTDNAYLTDSSIYLTDGIYNTDLKYTLTAGSGTASFSFRRSNVDCLSLVFDLDTLKGIYEDPTLTYDTMAIQDSVNDSFEFNSVLIYYTVYNSTMDRVLGRNLLGILFIDAPSGSSSDIFSSGILLPSLEKIQSGSGGFGTSYSLRLNIKTDNMVDDTQATIVDQATSDQLYAEDWSEAFANLSIATNILTQNNSTINFISDQYIEVRENQTQILNNLEDLQYQVSDIGRDIEGTENAIAMFSSGDDPLIDSSIYMRFGNVGVQTNDPEYPLHVVGTTKADEIIIENAIRDTSLNVLLGYGSPLQLGASTNYRGVDIYIGGEDPVITIDTSANIEIDADVSISGGFQVDGSSLFLGPATFDGSLYSSSFDFTEEYLVPDNVGAGLIWDGDYFHLDSSVAGATQLSELWDVSIDGTISNGYVLLYDTALSKWTYSTPPGSGDIAWSDGAVGDLYDMLFSNGDGSIVADSSIRFVKTGIPTLEIDADVSISGTLFVHDACYYNLTTFDTSVTNWHVLDDASIDNDLRVGNDASIGGNLFVTGYGIIDGSLFIKDILNAGNNKIINVLDPADSSDAVNKFYADNVFTWSEGAVNRIGIWGGDTSIRGDVGLTFPAGILSTIGGINLGTDASAELTLRGGNVTITNSGVADTGDTSINLMFDASTGFGGQTIAIERGTSVKTLTIRGQTYSAATGDGGPLELRGGLSGSSSGAGGAVIITGGTAPGTATAGAISITGGAHTGGGSGNGGAVTINGGPGNTYNGNVNIGTSNTPKVTIGAYTEFDSDVSIAGNLRVDTIESSIYTQFNNDVSIDGGLRVDGGKVPAINISYTDASVRDGSGVQSLFSTINILNTDYISNPGEKLYKIGFYFYNEFDTGVGNYSYLIQLKKGSDILTGIITPDASTKTSGKIEFITGAITSTRSTFSYSAFLSGQLPLFDSSTDFLHGTGDNLTVTVQAVTGIDYDFWARDITIEVLEI